MREIIVTYDSAADAMRTLKQIRRFGLGSPRDHLAVEILRVALICVPIFFVSIEIIRLDQAIAAYCGYFALRYFNRFAKPVILSRFGPRFPAHDLSSPLSLKFNADGVQSKTESGWTQLNWQAIPAARIFKKGVVLRIAPEQSLVVSATHLPDGMSPRDFGLQIEKWRNEAKA